MVRNSASQACLALIMWDGRADSFEFHVIQDCSAIQDWMDLHLGFRWGPHILGEYRWGMYYGVHLGYPSIHDDSQQQHQQQQHKQQQHVSDDKHIKSNH